ncbi:MAG: galactitol-1-phosphate 5-dehydrogenase [Bacilli bacterium]
MKASVLYGNEDLRYEECEIPKLEKGNVKIKVCMSGICGSDIPRVLKNGAHFYPLILGHEFSGIVDEVASDVKNFKVGDHVVGIPLIPCMKCEDCNNGNYSLCKHYDFIGSRRNGSNAEYVVLPKENVYKINDSIPFEQAAMFEPATVAMHAVKLLNFEKGKTVAILGAGTVGAFVTQIVKALGASKIVSFGRNPKKLKLASKLGATNVFSTLEEDFITKSKELTNGRGFDYVFETAGSVDTMKYAYELVGNKGKVCLIGTPTSNLEFTPKLWENLNRKEFILTGSWMSYSYPFPGNEWKEIESMFADGRLKYYPEMVHKIFDLKDAYKAFEMYKNGKVEGKILFKCSKD